MEKFCIAKSKFISNTRYFLYLQLFPIIRRKKGKKKKKVENKLKYICEENTWS